MRSDVLYVACSISTSVYISVFCMANSNMTANTISDETEADQSHQTEMEDDDNSQIENNSGGNDGNQPQ